MTSDNDSASFIQLNLLIQRLTAKILLLLDTDTIYGRQ